MQLSFVDRSNFFLAMRGGPYMTLLIIHPCTGELRLDNAETDKNHPFRSKKRRMVDAIPLKSPSPRLFNIRTVEKGREKYGF